MALPNQPADMTMTMVAAEIGATPPLSLGDSRVRALAGKPTGAISMADLRGKSAYSPPVIASETLVEQHEFVMPGAFADVSRAFYFSISGGEAPFTVTWTRVAGSTLIAVFGDMNPAASASGTAPWRYDATFKATVTDARNTQVESSDISIRLSAGQDIQ